MTKKNWFLILFTVALAIVYIVNFTDWFKPKRIQIYHTVRPLPPRRMPAGPQAKALYEAVPPVIFGFQGEFKLTSVKVLSVAELETNKYAVPLWNLVSDSNSAPTKAVIYGQPVRGMRLANKGQVAKPLVPGGTYRLFIEAGESKGELDFGTVPKPPAP